MDLTILPIFLGNARGWQLILIIGLFIVLFGSAKSITKTMRNVGKGVNAFKQGLEEAKAEINKPVEKITSSQEAAPKQAPAEGKAKDIKE